MKRTLLKRVSLLISTTLFLSISSASLAADGKALYAAKGCGGCHGPDAKSPIMPVYPKLASQSKEYAAQQMKDFKSGSRSNSQAAIMKALMAPLSDEEIDAVAEYLSSL